MRKEKSLAEIEEEEVAAEIEVVKGGYGTTVDSEADEAASV